MAKATTSEVMGKLFVGGISQATDSETIRLHFSKFGELTECEVIRDRITGNGRGFGFITFADPSVADRVLQKDHTILGRKVEVRHAKPKEEYSKKWSKDTFNGCKTHFNRKKIFVGGLPHNLTDGEMKNYFESFGTIVDVVVIHDKEYNRPRGFGFVTFDSEEAVDRVLKQSSHQLNNKPVEAKRAVPKDMRDWPMGYPGSPHHSICIYDAYNKGLNPNNFGAYTLPDYFYSGWGGVDYAMYPVAENFYRGLFCYEYPWSSFDGGASTSSSNGWNISTTRPALNFYGSCMSHPRHALRIESINGASSGSNEEGGVSIYINSTQVGKESEESNEVPTLFISCSTEASSSHRKHTENNNIATRTDGHQNSSTSCNNEINNEVPMLIILRSSEASSSLISKDTENENAGQM